MLETPNGTTHFQIKIGSKTNKGAVPRSTGRTITVGYLDSGPNYFSSDLAWLGKSNLIYLPFTNFSEGISSFGSFECYQLKLAGPMV